MTADTTDTPGRAGGAGALPDHIAAAAGMPHPAGGAAPRPDPAGLSDPTGAPGEAAGDYTLRPDPLGLHDPRPGASDAPRTGPHSTGPHPADPGAPGTGDAAAAVKEGVRSAGDRAAGLAGQAREAVAGLASGVQDRLQDRLGGVAEEARGRVEAMHERHMRRIDGLTVRGIDGLNRGRGAVERFVDDNPLLVGVVGVAAGLLLGALLPRTRQEDRNLGPLADEMRDQGLRYAREVTSMGRDFVQTALDPDNLNAAARKAAETPRETPAPPQSERAQHNL